MRTRRFCHSSCDYFGSTMLSSRTADGAFVDCQCQMDILDRKSVV